MKPSQALAHYETRKAIAQAAGISTQAVGLWFKEPEKLIPEKSARRLAERSGKKLPFDPSLYV